MKRTDERLAGIEKKLDHLINFKMRVIGMASVAAGLGMAVVQIAMKYLDL